MTTGHFHRRKTQRYGWKPDIPDIRDLKYRVAAPVALPPSVDLEDKMPAVYDQGQLGSCTANAIGAAVQFERMKQQCANAEADNPSRLFIYYNERDMENTINEDSGAQIRDGIKSVAKLGVCWEKEWPYEIRKFTIKPPHKCFEDALNNQAIQYARVEQTLTQMQQVLAQGHPIVMGFTVYDGFESEQVANTGALQMPTARERVIGGHAVLIVGYDNGSQRFKVRNSWGRDWGKRGYFTAPYEYYTNPDLADDFWVITMMEDACSTEGGAAA